VYRASVAFQALIAEQHETGTGRGDHFARPGANDRIWNALEKLAVRAPDTFVEYYANDVLALVSSAWLGPAYQVTSQVNVVNPGGAGQVGHRDYHLGFLTGEQIEQYPEHVHRLSPVLTLQGAVAHSDMPVETGPTCYLPHSQKYPAGYLATNRPEFREYFDAHHIQLPLCLGDAVFFNPAVIHGAGTNRTSEVKRMANLLQVSSAFGRAMESVDRERLCNAVYPAPHTTRTAPRTRWPRPPRATPSPPTSTSTHRWTASRRRARPTSCTARSPGTGHRDNCATSWRGRAPAGAPGEPGYERDRRRADQPGLDGPAAHQGLSGGPGDLPGSRGPPGTGARRRHGAGPRRLRP
jgi:ectoine hydroxylase-related dioxygenase (phytanoyl-CoA dioxygenase family)